MPLGVYGMCVLSAWRWCCCSGGCFGGSGSGSAPPHGLRRCTHAEPAKKAFRSTCAYQTAVGAWKVAQVSGVSPVVPIKVDWRVTYAVGLPKSDRSALPGCPHGARCRVLRDPHLASGADVHPWMEVAVRHVFCAASGQHYQDRRAARGGSARLLHLLRPVDKADGRRPGPASAADLTGRLRQGSTCEIAVYAASRRRSSRIRSVTRRNCSPMWRPCADWPGR